MHVAPIVEMLNASPVVTRPASLAQDSDQSPQTFKESLLAASGSFSDAGSMHEDSLRSGRRQNPVSDDMKSPHATLHSRVIGAPAPPQQTVQQQVTPAQQLPVIDPAPVVPLQLPPGGTVEPPKAVTVAVGPTRDSAVPKFPSIGSNIVQHVVVKPDSIPSVDPQEQGDPAAVASTLPSLKYGSQAAMNLSPAVTSTNPDSFVIAAPNPPSNIAFSGVAESTPSLVPDAAQTVVPATDPSAIKSAIQNAVPSGASSQAFSVSGTVQQPHPGATPTVAVGGPAQAVSDTVAKDLPDAVPHVTPTEVSTVVQNATSSPAATASSDAIPVPIAHRGGDGSAKGDVAQKSGAVSANQANPPAPPPSPDGFAAVPSVPGATADQLVAVIQPSGGLLVAAPAHAFNMSPAVQEKSSDRAVVDRKDGESDSINDVTGLKQHAPSESASAPSQSVSQDSSPSGDQSQGSASQQGQNAATAQLIVPNHTIAAADHSQNPGTAVVSQSAPALATGPDHTAKTPQAAAPAPIVVPQPVPLINTAKLIQSMGLSEMRVGMRSNDFGNISISTSATRDLISAQISLDHGELARTLATHLPEMQAKFGGDQAMNVRIDMNGHQPTGQGAGTSAGMSNGSADQSRGDRQQRGGGTSGQSGDVFAGQLNSIPTAALPSAESRLDVRLDIRV